MTKFPKTLLVIITEAALERALVRELKQFGAHGYTVHDVRGGGSSGHREGAWEVDRTIEMKIICDPDVADRIAEHVLANYANQFSLTLFFADVSVLRTDKY